MQLQKRQEKVSKVSKSQTKSKLEFLLPYFNSIFLRSSIFQIIFWNWKVLINCIIQATKVFWHLILHSYLCNVLYKFSSKLKATDILSKIYSEIEIRWSIKTSKEKLSCYMIVKNYLCNILCKFLIKVESTWRCEIKEQTPLLTLLHFARTIAWDTAVMKEIYIDASNFFSICYYKI